MKFIHSHWMIPSLKDPSYLGALVSFERAAVHLSFTQAAADLGVTPSAISHRIAALEAALQKRLFVRGTRSVQLTREGAALASHVTEIRSRLEQLTTELTSFDVLRVSLGPYFSSSWLMPRLQGFEQRNPDVRIDLVHTTGPPELRNADVAIFWSDLDPPHRDAGPLFQMECVPVAKPGLCAVDHFIHAGVPPLHYSDRRTWREWLDRTGLPTGFADEGVVFDDQHLLFEAAAHGRGVAMGLFPFIANLVDAGRLTPVSEHAVPSRQGYLLKVTNPGNPAAISFANWIRVAVSRQSGTRSTGLIDGD